MLNVSKLDAGPVLAEKMPRAFSLSEGTAVEASDGPAGYAVERRADGGVAIRHGDASDLMTALGDIVSGTAAEKHVHPFEFRGAMLDASRGGVPETEWLESFILRLALLGYNYFCLYTEDTFEVSGEPLIGYARGRLSKTEIRRLDAFASSIGTTIFPCVQTLGHMEQILRYAKYAPLRDTKRVLHTKKRKTIEFVGKLLENASEPYSTDIIHVGMDEPWGLGRGEAFEEGVPVNPLEIYAEHAAAVAVAAADLGLRPIMWGDVILGRSGGREMSDDEKAALPANLEMDYWNYFSEEESDYLRDIEAFRKMGREPIFSPGLHTWNRFFPDAALFEKTAIPGIRAARSAGLKKILATIWGDDGAECLFGNAAPQLALLAGEIRSDTSGDAWKKRLEAIFGISRKEAEALAAVESPAASNSDGKNLPAKTLFYDDPLIGAAARFLRNPAETAAAFAETAENLRKLKPSRRDSEFAALFAEIVAAKTALAADAADAYAKKDRGGLAEASEKSAETAGTVRRAFEIYEDLWLAERKPFGLEVVEGRFATLASRLETLAERIDAYLAGTLPSIAELEEPPPPGLAPEDLKFHSQLATRQHSIW